MCYLAACACSPGLSLSPSGTRIYSTNCSANFIYSRESARVRTNGNNTALQCACARPDGDLRVCVYRASFEFHGNDTSAAVSSLGWPHFVQSALDILLSIAW